MLANTSGFVYYVSIAGITGAAAPDAGKVRAAVARIKRHTQLPVAVGFGVRTAKQVREIAGGAEAVVVGSALVNAVAQSLDKKGKATGKTVKAVTNLVAELAGGVRGAKAEAQNSFSAHCRALMPGIHVFMYDADVDGRA